MGVYKNSSGTLNLLAGGTNFADNPIGSIIPFGGTTAPTGWFLCQGQAISRTTYSALFAVIGTSFGSGDGSTTFNIPDLRGEFLRGAGTNSHSGQGNGGSVGTHQNATFVPAIYNAGSGTTVVVPGKDSTWSAPDSQVAQTSGYRTISSVGGGTTNVPLLYSTRPTNTSVNYIIKALDVSLPADFESAIEDKIADNIVDSIADGNMKAVTSNAVYDGLALKQNKLVPTRVTGYTTHPTVWQNTQSITRYGNLVSLSVCFKFDTATSGTIYDGITGLPKAIYSVTATVPNEYGNAGTCFANIAANSGTLKVRCSHTNNYYYIHLVYFTND